MGRVKRRYALKKALDFTFKSDRPKSLTIIGSWFISIMILKLPFTYDRPLLGTGLILGFIIWYKLMIGTNWARWFYISSGILLSVAYIIGIGNHLLSDVEISLLRLTWIAVNVLILIVISLVLACKKNICEYFADKSESYPPLTHAQTIASSFLSA